MADRPRSPGSDPGPDPGQDQSGPDYRWLYGQGRPDEGDDPTRQVPQRPRPDETRVLPVQPRDRGAGTPPPPRPRPGRGPSGPPPAPPAGPSRGRRGFRRPRFRVRWLFSLLVLWLVFLVAVPFYAWTKVEKVEFEPRGDRPAEQPGTTYLLVGSDSRGDLSPAERKRLGTGGAEGQRTDTIMLLHTGSGPNLLLSIPRDSLVEVPGHGTTKINAAFAFGGAPLLTRTIEQSTGIRIDHYVEIGFGGFVDLVDAVGGIEICPEERMVDPEANLKIGKGCQEVDGVTALGYARSRKTYEQLGDVQRAQAQREVVSAIGAEVLSPWSVLNPVRYWRLNMAATEAVAFGEGMSPLRAAMWAMAMTRVDGEHGLTCGVPIADLAVHWDEERSQQMFRHIIEDDTESIDEALCSPSGLPAGAVG